MVEGEVLEERIIQPQEKEALAVREFLARFGLAPDQNVEYTAAVYCHNRLVASGSLAGASLCGIAVDPEFRGEGLAAKIVGNLINEAGRRGRFRYFVKTDKQTTQLFRSLGFDPVGDFATGDILLAKGFEQY